MPLFPSGSAGDILLGELPVRDGQPILGTWQQIVAINYDNRPQDRHVVIQVICR